MFFFFFRIKLFYFNCFVPNGIKTLFTPVLVQLVFFVLREKGAPARGPRSIKTPLFSFASPSLRMATCEPPSPGSATSRETSRSARDERRNESAGADVFHVLNMRLCSRHTHRGGPCFSPQTVLFGAAAPAHALKYTAFNNVCPNLYIAAHMCRCQGFLFCGFSFFSFSFFLSLSPSVCAPCTQPSVSGKRVCELIHTAHACVCVCRSICVSLPCLI